VGSVGGRHEEFSVADGRQCMVAEIMTSVDILV
jgi:hypothetical protein